MNYVSEIQSYVHDHREEIIHFWETLVAIDSGADCINGSQMVAEQMQHLLMPVGFHSKIRKQKNGSSMLISEYGDISHPFVLLIGHMDTVFPQGESLKRPFHIENRRVFGPGVLDMKGGLVIMAYAIKAWISTGHPILPIRIVLAGDEEINHRGSNAPDVFQHQSKGAVCCFNFETGFTDRGIVVQRKGGYQCRIETFGKACHVGNDPENGRSAVLELAYKIIEIEQIGNKKNRCHVYADVISGGTVVNAVPDHASVFCDFRYDDPEQLEEVKKCLYQITQRQHVEGVTGKLSEYSSMAPMKQLPKTQSLFEMAAAVSQKFDLPMPYPKYCGGGSDSAYTTSADIPTLCAMGVLGARNHTIEEYAELDSLFERCCLMAGLLEKLSKNTKI